jgi:hypothetical protein
MTINSFPEQRFEVGEVAIFTRIGSRFHGMEVTIIKPLHLALIHDQITGIDALAYVYKIDGPFGSHRPEVDGWAAPPEFLRKRRPPQDWIKLCDLASVSAKVPTDELA